MMYIIYDYFDFKNKLCEMYVLKCWTNTKTKQFLNVLYFNSFKIKNAYAPFYRSFFSFKNCNT